MLQRFGDDWPEREVKFAPVDLKSVEADGTFSGYASLFGEVDLGKDLVMPGAFRDSLAARGARGVKLLFQHDPNEPIGVWLELNEDARGLHARGRLMPEVTRAREVLSLMRAGALDGLSIGFRTVQGHTERASGVRRLDGARAAPAAKESLEREADAVAQAAALAAPGRLGQTVETRDESKGEAMVYAVGTTHRAGRFLEHGTVRRAATPWLYPAFRARLPHIKQTLRDTVVAAFKRRRGAV